MASSRISQGGPDAVDVLAVMGAFEEMNRCRLTLELSTEGARRWTSLTLQATAWKLEEECGGLPPSVLLSVRRPWELRQTMEAAILQLLYALDFQFAEAEFARVPKAE